MSTAGVTRHALMAAAASPFEKLQLTYDEAGRFHRAS